MTYKKLLTAASIVALGMAPALTSQAETIHTKTYTTTQTVEGATKVNLSEFDLDNNGIYSKEEVGKELFYIFDKDGNEVIDNLEWDNNTMLTVVPIEQETYTFVDYDNDGRIEQSSYSYKTFYEQSGLIKFDDDKDGLSAEEFIEVGYQALDINDNNVIDFDEWNDAYTTAYIMPNAKQARYNQ